MKQCTVYKYMAFPTNYLPQIYTPFFKTQMPMYTDVICDETHYFKLRFSKLTENIWFLIDIRMD